MAMLQQQSVQAAMQQARSSMIEKKILFSKIKKLEFLPLPSYSMLEITAIMKTCPDNKQAIADCISHDHVLLCQLYSMFFREHPGTIPGSILEMLEMLDPEKVRTLSYIPRMLDSFEERDEQEWNHSYSSRLLMENLLAENEIDEPLLIMAANLHDIGKNVFRDWSPRKYKIVEQHADGSKHVPFYKLERAVLQTDHAEVGAELLRTWGFPEMVCKVVEQHHSDVVPDEYVFETALLQFVNWIDCKARGIECDPPGKDLLAAAGIEEIESESYLIFQKQLIATLKANNAGSIRKDYLNELLAAERQVNSEENQMNEAVSGEGGSAQEQAAEETQAAEPPHAPQPEPEEAEPESNFDPESYVINSKPNAVAAREEELLRRMGLK